MFLRRDPQLLHSIVTDSLYFSGATAKRSYIGARAHIIHEHLRRRLLQASQSELLETRACRRDFGSIVSDSRVVLGYSVGTCDSLPM